MGFRLHGRVQRLHEQQGSTSESRLSIWYGRKKCLVMNHDFHELVVHQTLFGYRCKNGGWSKDQKSSENGETGETAAGSAMAADSKYYRKAEGGWWWRGRWFIWRRVPFPSCFFTIPRKCQSYSF